MPVSRRTAEGLAGDVAASYARAEVRLLQLIGKHLEAGAEAPDWAEAKLAELQVFRKRAERVMDDVTRAAVNETVQAARTAYLRGAAAGEAELGHAGIDTSDIAPKQAEHAVEALARAQADQLEDMGPRVVRQATDAYREAVSRASSGTLSGATTRLQDAQVALDDLARKGISGFTDRSGRQWGLESYVDMATRTTTAQAAIQGQMDRLEQAGISLFIVSESSRECETCRKWEGLVLSRGPVDAMATNVLTGEMEQVQVDGTVQEATSAGLFHPNCTHNLSGYIHGATKRGEATGSPEGYAEKQQQRAMERKVREWKRRQAAAITPEAKRKADAKVAEWQGKLRDHTKATGLPRKGYRESFDVEPRTVSAVADAAPDPAPTFGRTLLDESDPDRHATPLKGKGGNAASLEAYENAPFSRADSDFRYISDPDDRATGLLQYWTELAEQAKRIASNRRAGRDPFDGIKLDTPEVARTYLSDGYDLTDLRADLEATADKLNRWESEDLGTVYRGVNFAPDMSWDDVLDKLETKGWDNASVSPLRKTAMMYAGRADRSRSVVIEIEGSRGIKLDSVGNHAHHRENLLSGDIEITGHRLVDDPDGYGQRMIVRARHKHG